MLGPGGARHHEEHQGREDEQQAHRHDDAPRHVALGVAGLLGRERHTLDGQEEPDAVDQRGHGARDAVGQEAARHHRAVGVDVEELAGGELRSQADDRGDEGDDGDRGDAEHQLERLADAVQVHPDEHGVGDRVDQPAVGQPEQAQGLDVAADEHRDRGGRDGVLDQHGHAGREAADRAQGPASEAVAGAGDGKGGGHLGQAEDHAGVHHTHQHGGDQQAAPAALVEPEVPAREVAGDHVADAETRQQDPAGRSSAERALAVVVVADVLVVHS